MALMLGGHGGENALSEEDKDRIEQSFTEDVREIEEKYGSNVCCGLCCPFWKCGEYSFVEKNDGQELIVVVKPGLGALPCIMLCFPPVGMMMISASGGIKVHALNIDGKRITYRHEFVSTSREASEDIFGVMIVSHSANEHGEMKGRHFKMQRNGSYLNSRMETQGHAGLLEEIGTIVNEFLRARREEYGVKLGEPQPPRAPQMRQPQTIQMQPMNRGPFGYFQQPQQQPQGRGMMTQPPQPQQMGATIPAGQWQTPPGSMLQAPPPYAPQQMGANIYAQGQAPAGAMMHGPPPYATQEMGGNTQAETGQSPPAYGQQPPPPGEQEFPDGTVQYESPVYLVYNI